MLQDRVIILQTCLLSCAAAFYCGLLSCLKERVRALSQQGLVLDAVSSLSCLILS